MIIADTSAILAAIDVSAASHEPCAHFVQHADEPLLVSHMVVAEADYLLTTRFGVATANRFLTDVVAGGFQLAPSDEEDLEQAISVNTRYGELGLGVTDSLNVVLAARYGTTRVFTLDERHFRVVRPLADGKAFTLLPSDEGP